jgi:hypothetical protein
VGETFRMLGREHETDSKRETAKRRIADRARSRSRNTPTKQPVPGRRRLFFRLSQLKEA